MLWLHSDVSTAGILKEISHHVLLAKPSQLPPYAGLLVTGAQ